MKNQIAEMQKDARKMAEKNMNQNKTGKVEQSITICFENREEALKLASEFVSILTSGRDIPETLTVDDLPVMHIENPSFLGRTLCRKLIADGIKAVKIGNTQKVNCELCKTFL
jgi:hypothetical protein